MRARAGLAIVVIVVACASQPVIRAIAPHPLSGGLEEPHDYAFEFRGETITISLEAVLRRGTLTLQLPVEDMYIEKLQYAAYGDDLLLFCELSDGEGGLIRFMRVSNERVEVVASLPELALKPVIIDGTRARVKTYRVAGCLDVVTGAFREGDS